MDELELLSRFRAGMPGPDPQTVSRNRARLLERATRPAPDPSWRRGTPWARRAALAGLVAALVAGLAVVREPRTPGLGVEPAAAAALDRAARAAADETPLAPGQYAYTKTVATRGGWCSRDEGIECRWSVTIERWQNRDGAGRLRVTNGPLTFPHPGDRERFNAKHPHGLPWRPGVETDRRLNAAEIAYDRMLREQPTDLELLWRSIRERVRRGNPKMDDQSLDWVTFDEVTASASRPMTPPALRAALFKVLLRIRGVGVFGDTTDALGRRAIAVGLVNSYTGLRLEVLFDRATYRMLGIRQLVALEKPGSGLRDEPVGTVVADVVDIRAVVDSSDATPRR
jgi:hypothetical protein